MAPPVWEITLGMLLLAGISAVFFLWRRTCPYLLVGWSWYLVMLAPILVLIGKGMELRCDRYTYLPQIGLYLLLAWAAADLCAGWRHHRVVLGGCATIILVALIFCARIQTSYWQNSESLWIHALDFTSGNYVAHNNLGAVFFQQKRMDEAIMHFQQSLEIKPDYAEAHYNLGTVLLQQGRIDEAIAHFQKAVEIKPDHASAHKNLGIAFFQQGRMDEAIAHFKKSLEIRPDQVEIQNNLAWLLATCPRASLRNGSQAVELAQRANQLTGDNNPNLLCTLAAAYAEAGRFTEAVETAQRALQLAETYSNPALAGDIRSEAEALSSRCPVPLTLNKHVKMTGWRHLRPSYHKVQDSRRVRARRLNSTRASNLRWSRIV